MTKKERPPKVVYLAIRQTLTTVWVRLLSDNRRPTKWPGRCKGPGLDRLEPVLHLLQRAGHFPPEAQPRAPGRHLPDGQRWAAKADPWRVWTSRDTKGILDMDSHVSVVAQTFPDAVAIFVEAPRAE